MDWLNSALANADRSGSTALPMDERTRHAEKAALAALVSIAESLASIAEHGIETYQLDGDGHRR